MKEMNFVNGTAERKEKNRVINFRERLSVGQEKTLQGEVRHESRRARKASRFLQRRGGTDRFRLTNNRERKRRGQTCEALLVGQREG